VLRFAAFYGADSKFLHELTPLVRHGFAPLFGSPAAFISSVSHDDAARAVLTALNVPSGAYNVSDDEPVTHRVFADALASAIGVATPRLPPLWRISNAKLRAYAWEPTYRSVREGFRAIAGELAPARDRRSGRRPVHQQ
jgi:nucleoside-diphosphate-sugar epimerase